jgi:8-oxo-dGTP diphosphatase
MQQILNQLSIDCVLFGYKDETIKVLLLKRKQNPEKGKWALPGGFIQINEDIDDASKRILFELTGVSNLFMEQIGAFGKVNRYPVSRVVTLSYFSLINPSLYEITAGADAESVEWVNIQELPKLVFDHTEIMKRALEQLQFKARYAPIGFELLPKKFTLHHLQKLYQAIFSIEFDKPNFRRKIKKLDILKPLDETWTDGIHRSAQLYSFDLKKYKQLQKDGMHFEIY